MPRPLLRGKGCILLWCSIPYIPVGESPITHCSISCIPITPLLCPLHPWGSPIPYCSISGGPLSPHYSILSSSITLCSIPCTHHPVAPSLTSLGFPVSNGRIPLQLMIFPWILCLYVPTPPCLFPYRWGTRRVREPRLIPGLRRSD